MNKLSICSSVLLIYSVVLVITINIVTKLMLCIMLDLFLVLVYITKKTYKNDQKEKETRTV